MGIHQNTDKKGMLFEIKDRFDELNKEFKKRYGKNYPKDNDSKGWLDYGKLQALAWVIARFED